MLSLIQRIQWSAGQAGQRVALIEIRCPKRIRTRWLLSVMFTFAGAPLYTAEVIEGEEPPALARSCAARAVTERAAPRARSVRMTMGIRSMQPALDARRIRPPITGVVRPSHPPAIGFRV